VLGDCSDANAEVICMSLGRSTTFSRFLFVFLNHDKIMGFLVIKITPRELCSVSLLQLGKGVHCARVTFSLTCTCDIL